jgi:hypothetical protein
LALDSLLTLAANLAAFSLEATEGLAISWMYFQILLPTSVIWLALSSPFLPELLPLF